MPKENIKSPRNSPSSKAYKAQRRDLMNMQRKAKKHLKRIAYFAKRREEKRRNAYLQGRMNALGDCARDHRPITRKSLSMWVPYTPVAKVTP